MNKKLWGGRFKQSVNKMTEQFGASIEFDQTMYAEDIAGSIAHAKGLAKQGIISQADAQAIVAGLNSILNDIKAGKIEFSLEDEDIHMNIERMLTEKIGEAGKKLHTGRSRNDQVALDIRLYMKKSIIETTDNLKQLVSVLVGLAENHLDTPMPAYTHMQKAQAITLAHYLMAYAQMFMRDIDRFYDTFERTDYMPLGAGALAGTTYPLDREYVAKELGFKHIAANSLDAVSDRDFVIEYLANASIAMMHLSRFCEELVYFNTQEFGFITLADTYSTGSSIMPQKKNPDFAELIRGKTGRVYGALVGILTVMKALPLAYNKDMQEDKEGVFDTIDTLNTSLKVFTDMIATATFNTGKMRYSAGKGFINATEVADYLVGRGMSFRDAHTIVGKIVLYAENQNVSIDDLKLAQLKEFSPLFEPDVYKQVSLETSIARRSLPGGPAKQAVLAQIKQVKDQLKLNRV
ncbi:argininosuccinate lyase [Candidatus Saccharibacteria bacterium]|nr:argininosuccinate lyase [Candidatus Saccharibacteria bacterium]